MCWAPLETLPLGYPQGVPLRDRTHVRMAERAQHERGAGGRGCAEDGRVGDAGPTNDWMRMAGVSTDAGAAPSTCS